MSRGHVILVGLPGAGKTTVGGIVATHLDMPFVDVDALIEERVGASAARIFADRGEAAFRHHERESVSELVARDRPHVIAPGGGWAAEPGSLASVAGHALTVYLETPPAVAAERIKGTGHRPLLDSGSPGRETSMRELYRRRRRCYAACDAVVDTADRTAVEVARKVAELAKSQRG